MASSGTYVAPAGAFERDTEYLDDRITVDGRSGFPVEPGRYRLVVARACPWAHRAIIVRRLLGLEDALSMAIAGPEHDERSWDFRETAPGGRDPVLGIERLRDAYLARDPGYGKGITVPAIVDVPSGAVVTNDVPQLTLDLSTEWRPHHRPGAPDLYPVDRRDEIDEVMEAVYRDVNDGVYRCGFAGDQAAYDNAVHRLFARLDELAERLSGQRYLVGGSITEADVRLFTTLVRFDAVYHGHFKCNLRKLTEQPVLWAYARDLFQTPGFGDTVDFDHIKRHYYCVHEDLNPSGIVPAGPDLAAWHEPHGRDRLGAPPSSPGPRPARSRSTRSSHPITLRRPARRPRERRRGGRVERRRARGRRRRGPHPLRPRRDRPARRGPRGPDAERPGRRSVRQPPARSLTTGGVSQERVAGRDGPTCPPGGGLMSDPALTPEAERELLVVYPDHAAAEAARRALLEVGVREDAIHLDEEPDVVASLRSEMHEELSQAWVVPNAGVVYPKEAARGLLAVCAIGGAIGLLVAVPLALVDFGSTYWVRLAIWAGVGLAFGLAIGLVAGPATGASRPSEPPAAVRGVLLRVEQDTAQLRSVLATDDVVRMDEITHAGDPVGTVTTEGDRSVVDTAVETAKDVAANATGDDYHRER